MSDAQEHYLSFRVGPELKAAIDEHVEGTGETRSAFIVRVIRAEIGLGVGPSSGGGALHDIASIARQVEALANSHFQHVTEYGKRLARLERRQENLERSHLGGDDADAGWMTDRQAFDFLVERDGGDPTEVGATFRHHDRRRRRVTFDKFEASSLHDKYCFGLEYSEERKLKGSPWLRVNRAKRHEAASSVEVPPR